MKTQYKKQAEFLNERFKEVLEGELDNLKTKLYQIEHRFEDESFRGIPIDVMFKDIQNQISTTNEKLTYINKRLYQLAISPSK